MSTSLRWEVVPGPERIEVSLSGFIDDQADLDVLLDAIPAGPAVRFGLAQVHRVSSAGVWTWIRFMGKLKARGVEAVFEDCSICIVRQLNMLSQFRGHATVRSVHAPYYCARCNQEHLRVIDLTADVPAQMQAPFACPTCGSVLELDEEEALFTELPA